MQTLYKTAPTEDNWRQLTVARLKLNHRISHEMTWGKKNHIRRSNCELGNKPSNPSLAIPSGWNITTCHPKEINRAFYEVYNNLYKRDGNYPQGELDNRLQSFNSP